MALELQVRDYPPLQRSILETIREHGTVDASVLLKATGANRNTVKVHMRSLVEEGRLRLHGKAKGAWYSAI